LNSDVVRVLLRLPPSSDFEFIPGQYIDIIRSNGIRRSYSLANASFEKKLLELHVKAVPGGVMSEYWFKEAKQNDLLRLHGPLGTFFLRKTAGLHLIFLATGTGIAPIKAILDSIPSLPRDLRPSSVTVVWGARHLNDHYLKMADTQGVHTYIPVLSRPSEGWVGARGYVQDVLLELKSDLRNAIVYACGSDAMVKSVRARLIQAGLPESHIFSDAFVCTGSL
jgi:CDP-4-dehydro-6-deoxyglucose reductase